MTDRSQRAMAEYGHVPAIYDAQRPDLRGKDDNAFVVFASQKKTVSGNYPPFAFILFERGYTPAWNTSRRMVRIGTAAYGPFLPTDPIFADDGTITNPITDVEPGGYKIDRLFKLDRKPRKEFDGVTGRELADAFVKRGMGNKSAREQLLQLLDEMEKDRDDDDGDDNVEE